MAEDVIITAVGNAGFQVDGGGLTVFIDAFYDGIRGVADPPFLDPGAVERADAILVTHDHGDHCAARPVAALARRTGAVVVAPASAIRAMRGLDPAAARPVAAGALPGLPVGLALTAFRTWHGGEHWSYLIGLAGRLIFHDGDNENTRILDPAVLRPLDCLLIGPWQGSGWVEFCDALRPGRLVIMHLTAEERAEHARGTYFQALVPRLPEGLTVLAPGESIRLQESG